MVILTYGAQNLIIIDEPNYRFNSTDNRHHYEKAYSLGNKHHLTVTYGLCLEQDGERRYIYILGASGGMTAVHGKTAVVIDDTLYIGLGDTICALQLPSFELLWQQQGNWMSCFGLYHVVEHGCLLIHGELTIARLNWQGEIIWEASGRDIFSEGFAINAQQIKTIDFNHDIYEIDINTGKAIIINE